MDRTPWWRTHWPAVVACIATAIAVLGGFGLQTGVVPRWLAWAAFAPAMPLLVVTLFTQGGWHGFWPNTMLVVWPLTFLMWWAVLAGIRGFWRLLAELRGRH